MRYVILLLLLLAGAAQASVLMTSDGTRLLLPTISPNTDVLKQVASGIAYTPNTLAASTSTSMISRKCGYARQRLPYQKLVYWGSSVLTGAPYYGTEVSNDNNESINAWIEYPTGASTAIGTTTTANFSGAANGTLTAGQLLTSDPVYVSIPNNAAYCVITYVTPNSGHITYMGGFTPVSGASPLCTSCSPAEKTTSGTSGVPTNPLAFTSTGNFTTGFVTPIAVIGPSTGKAVCLLGDSRVQGSSDTGDSSYDLGSVARSIGPEFPYINMGINGHTMASFVYSHAGRAPLFSYCDAVIDEMGANDVNRSTDAAPEGLNGAIGYKKKMAYLFSGNHSLLPALPYSWSTIEPFDSSTDTWATCTNQTAGAANSNIHSFNTQLRTPSTYGVSTYFDVAAAVETGSGGGASGNCAYSLTGGKWQSNGTANYFSNDGSHETLAGALNIKNQNRIKPSLVFSALAPTTTNPTALAMTTSSATYDTSTMKFGTAALNGGFTYSSGAVQPQSLPFTLAGWVKLSTAGSQFSAIFGGYQPRCFLDTTGVFYGCGIGSDTANQIVDNVAANDNTWHYLEASYYYNIATAKITYTMCKDGALVGSNSSTVSTSTYNLTRAPFTVRSQPEALNLRLFAGSIDDVVVYNTSRYADNGNACSAVPTVTFTSSETNMIVGYHLDSSGAATVGPAGQ